MGLPGTSYVNFDKARTTRNVQNDTVPANLGQYAKVTNVYGQPDITQSGSTLDAFKEVQLYDQQTVTRGQSAGTQVGLARSRAFEYGSGDADAVTGIYNHYLFDVTMFNTIDVSAANTLTLNALITGVTVLISAFILTSIIWGIILF